MVRTTPELMLADSDAPLHERLAQAITELIASGHYAIGDRLPTHRELARQAGVAIGTVTKAIESLSSRGIVRGEVGRGTFINTAPQASRSGPIDLTVNVPPLLIDEALFIAATERAARKVLTIPNAELYDLKGSGEQRAILAGWLSRTRLAVDPAELFLSVGGQQAIHVAFADLRRISGSIACESATFSGAIAAAADLGLDWSPVDHDDEGMIPAELDRVLAETGCRAIYTVPVCQNPFGFEVSDGRRREILNIARKHDAFIVEDDIYGIYAAKGSLTYKQLDPGRTYYLNGFSKCLTPLARVGLLVAPEDRAGALARALRAQVFGAPAMPIELGCALIELEADRIAADALRAEAKARTVLAADILSLDKLPMPGGAPHLWLPMPAIEAERLARRASQHGVRLTPPDATAVGGAKAGGIRLCILTPKHRGDLERAAKILSTLLQDTEELVV